MLKAAQNTKVDKVAEFLATRFGKRTVPEIMRVHEAEEGRPIETLWDVTTAVTAMARSIPNQDDRVKLERQAGDILAMAV